MESNMMQSAGEGCLDIAELASQLSREKIFINSERQQLQSLNEQVEKSALELLQAAWICSQQRHNLANLLASKSETESVAACQRASLLEDTVFIDAHKVLKYKEANAVAELLGWLRDSPHLVALCLLLGEDHIPANLIPSMVAGLYGSCRSQDDKSRLLAVIRYLIKHQMVPSSDPRKLIRSGRGVLASLYSVFLDGHTPARQFLVTILQGPVMAVLHEDEFFLDIDPDKAMERFSHTDRLKKFGQPNSPEYAAKVGRYRKWAVQSLYNLSSKFIASMKEHWPCFPSNLAWIVQQMVTLLKQHARTSERELHALSTDLILTQYICAAIVNPEAHGIVEVPVSYVARFNLMQIAQILQTLGRAKYQEVDGKTRDVYSKFDRGCVCALVEGVWGGTPAPPAPPAPPARAAPAPRAALYTPRDLAALITFLKAILSKLNNNTPSVTSEDMANSSTPTDAGAISESSSASSGGSSARLCSLLHSVEPNYRARLLHLLPAMPPAAALRFPTDHKDQSNSLENGSTPKRGILAKVPKPRLPRSASSNSALAMEDKQLNGEREEKKERVQVLVIKLASLEEQEYVGMEPEWKVLECYYGGSEAGDNDDAVSALAASGPPPVQKRTRFSVSHDEVSLGNTSDNLEAVSEAASNHSVTSSLELETEDQNDNLSDMVSANVSGRGSPNISGRETPSSQVTDNDAPPRRPVPQLPMTAGAAAQAQAALKQSRKEIEDKFCKFEIKKLLEGDETISIMSDTWSTDVLASDSETIGDSCDNTQVLANQGANTSSATAPDVSETASESAWSVDVLASDSDRNTEADADDCASVAARSDTSWPRRPSNQDETTPVKQLNQNGTIRKPDMNSPRHTGRPGLPHRSGSGYLSATAALSRGAELDVFAQAQPQYNDTRKSVLVNGCPLATGFATSAPESPSTSAPANDLFDYAPQNGRSSAASESTLEGTRQSDATSQWVDDSFPSRAPPQYEDNDPSEQSNDPNDPPSSEGSVADDLVARLASATITTTRLVTSQIRTSVVSISSSRVERKTTNEVSLSTLSVNSIESTSDKSSSQDVNSEIVTERRISPPPKPSTGAIPKSISFDSTAEKTQRRKILGEEGLVGNFDELKNNMKRSGGNILNKIKMFRQKGRHQQHGTKLSEEEPQVACNRGEPGDSSEEILAKYRRADSGTGGKKTAAAGKRAADAAPAVRCTEGVVDLNDPEVFNSMKRKLRSVLSNPDLQCAEYVSNWGGACLVQYMSAAGLAGAAGAGELARALAGCGGAPRLAAALRADLAARRPYAAYLAACRAALTHTSVTINNEMAAVRRERCGGVRAAAAARVLQQLERGGALRRLLRAQRPPATHHHHYGELMDEKVARLMASIKAITAEIKADPSWDYASQTALEMIELTVERAAFAQIYLQVLFPNGDGDIARDQVLSEHIRRLSASVSATSVGVGSQHVWAAPFPRAQAALRHLPVYRTPRDKISCVMRCVNSIMSVLGLDGSAPSADDLTPVLIYVIIKVNPSSLLSTLELVSAWGGSTLSGESLYWWTQFCAAVAYIKTMDYTQTS